MKLLLTAKRKKLRRGKVVRGLLCLLLERGHRAATKWQPHRTATTSTVAAAGETTEKDEAGEEDEGEAMTSTAAIRTVITYTVTLTP